MLPMGTIVAICMLLGIIAAVVLPTISTTGKLSGIAKSLIAGITLAAGCWNFFWYGLQHVTEFWGQMALLSGLLMIVTALYIAKPATLPAWLLSIKPLVLIALLLCMLKYAHTIYHL